MEVAPVKVFAPWRVVTPPLVVLMMRDNVPPVAPLAIIPLKVVPPTPDPLRVRVKGVLATFVTVAPTVNRLLESFSQFWLAPILTALFRVTVPELALMSMPPEPMLRAVVDMVNAPVVVVPSPDIMPLMLVVPAFGWAV